VPEYYIVKRGDSAICVCRIGDNVMLVRQYRPGIRKVTLCHPGGRIEEADDSTVQGVLRELLEETGLVPDEIRALGKFAQIPAVETDYVHLFVANCTKASDGFGKPDVTEDLSTELVPVAQLEHIIEVGGMDCVACVAASYRLLLDTAVGRQQIRSSDEEN
jgi:ADP-ribose pyrophosphatase